MTHKTVANKLKEIRGKKSLTQAELAEQVGVSRVSILSIEKGHFLPTIETALRISSTLDIPVEEIFWLKENYK